MAGSNVKLYLDKVRPKVAAQTDNTLVFEAYFDEVGEHQVMQGLVQGGGNDGQSDDNDRGNGDGGSKGQG